MRIAYNPKTAQALMSAPNNEDITFDLSGLAIYVKGVKFEGKTYSVFKKHTLNTTGGYDGLVPAPSYTETTERYLREDGTWVVPNNTTANLADYVTLNGDQTISGVKTFSSLLNFTVASGTSPFTVSSTTKVDNLNADLLDDLHSTDFVRQYGVVGANFSIGNWLGYTYATEAHGGPVAGGVISVGGNNGMLLVGSHTGTRLYYRGINGGAFTDWKRVAFTDSDITGNAASADKINNTLTLKINSGTTEGTDLYTYDGSSAKTLNIQRGKGIGFTNTEGVLSIHNAGVRSIATGTTNGTISVNTNGTLADVAVKGLGSAAYTSSGSYVRLGYIGGIDGVVELYSKLKSYFGDYSVSITKFKDERGVWGHLLSKFQNPDLGLYGVDGCGLFLAGGFVERWSISGKNTTEDPLVLNKHKIYDESNLGVVSSSAAGLAPKVINTNSDTVGSSYYVLASSNGSASPSWYKLPTNAFKNDNTTYTFTSGTTGNFTVTPSGGTAQTVSIGKPATAGTADIAVKLQTKRKLWGLDFDGSADVSGDMIGVRSITASGIISTLALYGLGLHGGSNLYFGIREGLALGIEPYDKDGTWLNNGIQLFLNGNVSIGSTTNSEKLYVNGNVKATSFIGNLDGTYVNKLTGYAKATAIGSIAATDSLNTALGKLEFKTDFIYNDLFGTDNDDVINKWHEIVDFVDSVAEGTDITDEFVTRKTNLTIIGLKTFSKDVIIYSGNYGVRLIGSEKYGYLQLGLWSGDGTKIHRGQITGIYNETLSSLNIKSETTTATGTFTATKFITSGGTSSQFVKGDGSLDSNTYATTTSLGNYLPLTGGVMGKTAYISWGKDDTLNDVDDWSTVTNVGLRIISNSKSTEENTSVPTRYCTALHVRGRYGFLLASQGGYDTTSFFIRNIANTKWNTILHSGNSYINNGIITINGTSITPLTAYLDLSNYVTLNTALTITGSKTFTASTNTFSGTSAGILTVDRNSTNPAWIKFCKNGTLQGFIGITNDFLPVFLSGESGASNKILIHSGNYTSYLPFLNSASTRATNSSVIYAPTSGGTSGQILKSNGSSAPSWVNLDTIAAGSAVYLAVTSLNTEEDIVQTGVRAYSGSGANWTGEIKSMQYAAILTFGYPNRGCLIWCRRGNSSLRYRNGLEDYSGWNTERIILDSNNYTSYLGYIGTTAVQASSAEQALTGITNLTMNGTYTNNNKLDIHSSGCILPHSTSTRTAGMYGKYDSTKVGHVWSMGTDYKITDDGSSTNNMHGLVYFHTNWSNDKTRNTATRDGSLITEVSTYAGGHQIAFVVNGQVKVALGDRVWSRAGFLKSGSSDSYILLGGGGHKKLSDFLLKSEELTNNLTTITKSLKLTKDWQDTGIILDAATFKHGHGTYAVQVYIDAGSTEGFWYSYFSGIMSVYTGYTNADEPDDEIILHHSSHANIHRIYLKTKPTSGGSGHYSKIQIACNKNFTAARDIQFKFKKLI